jgi:hypothetical protein
LSAGDRRVSARRDAFVVFGVALVARLAIVAWAHARFPPAEDGHYYDVLARRIAAGAGYTWLWPDGAVTYAAHYPVGYPGILAAAYAVFGASAAVAMTANAVLGAAGAFAAHALVAQGGASRARALAAGLTVALHPALVPYTAAVMTEGATASLLLVGAALATGARRTDGTGAARLAWPGIIAAGLAMGVATLVRPPSLLAAPVFGWLAGRGARSRLAAAAAVTAIALACIAPWTARNCVRMHRCAPVSLNGGWNLLLGARTTSGAWEPLVPPAECATVWDEAAKDTCFEGAARREILAAPGRWLRSAPAKLAVTFDYFGAAPWYLHSSGPEAFGDRDKLRLAVLETVACRLLLLAALLGCALQDGPRAFARKAIALAGAAAAATPPGWLGYLALVACIALLGRRGWEAAPPIVPATAAVVAATALIHIVFFGAGRYGLVVAPFVAALAASSLSFRAPPQGGLSGPLPGKG